MANNKIFNLLIIILGAGISAWLWHAIETTTLVEIKKKVIPQWRRERIEPPPAMLVTRVYGRIINTDNQPMPNVKIFVFNPEGKVVKESATDKDGRYDIKELGLFYYFISCEFPGYGFTELAADLTKGGEKELNISTHKITPVTFKTYESQGNVNTQISDVEIIITQSIKLPNKLDITLERKAAVGKSSDIGVWVAQLNDGTYFIRVLKDGYRMLRVYPNTVFNVANGKVATASQVEIYIVKQ